MQKLSTTYFQRKLIIENSIATLNIGGIKASVDISDITPEGCVKYVNQKEECNFHTHLDWSLIRILGAVITIQDYLPWGKRFTINRKISSYGLKHTIEKLEDYHKTTKLLGKESSYLSNGELIVAMLLLGYKKKNKRNSYNCFFNLSEKK